MEDAFHLPVLSNWLSTLRSRLLTGYKKLRIGPPTGLPIVTYVSRQGRTGSRFSRADHELLVRALSKLEDDGLAIVRVEELEHEDKPTQIARISQTTVLISIHGNGITHLLFMEPTLRSAIFEVQPHDAHMDDYPILAEAVGIPHWIMQRDKFCTRSECGGRGAPWVPALHELRARADARSSQIRRRARWHCATRKPPARAGSALCLPLYPWEVGHSVA